MVYDMVNSSATCSATPPPTCNETPKNFIMFFAAERELQQKRGREPDKLVGGISILEDSNIYVGSSIPRSSPVNSLEVVYPEFTSSRVEDVVRIVADHIPNEEPPPTKKFKHSPDHYDESSGFSEHSESIPRRGKPPVPNSFDDLLQLFPQIETLLNTQKQKLEQKRIPDEYIRNMEKPKLPIAPPPAETKTENSWQPTFSVESSKPQEPPPLPTGIGAPAAPAQQGGGLLSGIDDLFGSPKRKPRNKRR
jgi:hypothetical protein